jgi:hypothetical protein
VDDSTTGSIILKSVQRFIWDPEYDLTQYFTDVSQRSNYPQLVEDDVENRLTRHDDEEYIWRKKGEQKEEYDWAT